MLISRGNVHSPAAYTSFVNRLRLQVPIVWIFAVAFPSVVVYQRWIPAESDQAVFNSAIAAFVATTIGQLTLRRVSLFPGINSFAFILPSLAISFGVCLLLFLGLRLPYSRSVLFGSFAISVFVVFALTYFGTRVVRPRFLMVPGGDVTRLRKIEEADWELLTEPVVPPQSSAMIVADFRYDHPDEWERMLAHSAISGRIVYHSKLLSESLTGRVAIEHLSENSFGSLLPNLAYAKVKRSADLLLSMLLLLPFVTAMIPIAIVIALDSTGPVLFRQARMGFQGKPFRIFKFRTMAHREVPQSEEAARRDAMTDDSDLRVTRVGRFLRKTRLDEIPQIFNILLGHMSWIGPRPEAAVLSSWYEREVPFYTYRHIVRPGLSGWAQVNQGHVTEVDAIAQKLEYDFYYVKYFSAWLDIVIAFRTISIVVNGMGAR